MNIVSHAVSGRGLISQAIWFLYLFISSAITKVGSLFINTQISAALIRERRLLPYFLN